jgi:hypothetical protein
MSKARPARTYNHRAQARRSGKVVYRERAGKMTAGAPRMPVPSGHVATLLPSYSAIVRLRSEQIREEFLSLEERWRRDTKHLSQVSKKVVHPAYFRIMGMVERVIPLLLEALRDRPAHWFEALKATANEDPVTQGSSPSIARETWLEWGKRKGLID